MPALSLKDDPIPNCADPADLIPVNFGIHPTTHAILSEGARELGVSLPELLVDSTWEKLRQKDNKDADNKDADNSHFSGLGRVVHT